MKIYIVCPVGRASKRTNTIVLEHVKQLEKDGHKVHLPFRDIDKSLPLSEINRIHRDVMQDCDEVHLLWDPWSHGSHFDLGMAVAFNKRIIKIALLDEDHEGESYWRSIE